MPIANFKNQNIVIEVEAGSKLSDCMRTAGLFLETPCNCIGLCGKCTVAVSGEVDAPSIQEKELLSGKTGLRLACLARVAGDVEIDVIKSSKALNTMDINETNEGVSKNRLKDLNNNAGIAVDIGTTGLSACLVDLVTGELFSKVSALNPQIEFGSDVISRITFAANNEDGTIILRNSIVTKINEIIKELCNGIVDTNYIYKIMVAANTTMLHLFAGVNPVSMAKAPYNAVFLDKIDMSPVTTGIDINKEGIITLLPSLSSYVGADVLSGLAATEFHKRTQTSLFIDIGTNGEIVVISDGRMAATSTAAGPALEGMNISCGCRAEEGAIDNFIMDEDYNISFTTIGNAESPIGICGSGLIDIAAGLVNMKIILPNGRFSKDLPDFISKRLKDKRFYITEDIFISQKDIRQIQLAKGAIASGVTMLLEKLDISIYDVKEIFIAGAFGYHLSSDNIKTISLIPKGFKGKITYVGNSSLEGARLALLDENVLKTMESIRRSIKVLELSTSENFQKYFIEALSF